MTCLRCKHPEVKRFGFYGRKRIQRYRCPGCNSTFSEPRKRPLGRHYTNPEKAAQIATLLLEGMSVRAVSRITSVHQGTILSLLLTIGDKCRSLFDKRVRDIRPRFVQADELWTFVHTKERHMRPGSPDEWGDSYIWMAIDSDTKMVLSYLVAKREAMNAYAFIRDLSERVTGRFQLTTDGLRSYVPAVEEYFGADVDFAQLVKLYGTTDGEGPDWYQPSKVTATIPVVVSGDPDESRISTSHVERANLTVRTRRPHLDRSRASDMERVGKWLSKFIRAPPPATLNQSTTHAAFYGFWSMSALLADTYFTPSHVTFLGRRSSPAHGCSRLRLD